MSAAIRVSARPSASPRTYPAHEAGVANGRDVALANQRQHKELDQRVLVVKALQRYGMRKR